MSTATLYEVRDGAAWITLNQPERRNALGDELIQGLQGDLTRAIDDASVRTIVLTGAGTAFCAGADLKAGGGSAVSADDHPFIRILRTIWDSPKPVIARVNGHAFGGGIGLAAACDLAVAADGAAFSFSEVRIGIVPAMISVVVLPKIGIQQAMALFLTGDRFSASRACEIGLVHRVVAAEQLDEVVRQWSRSIRQGGPNAVRAAKELIRRVPQMHMDQAFHYTADLIKQLFASPEAHEGMRAFAEKRPPAWAGPGNE